MNTSLCCARSEAITARFRSPYDSEAARRVRAALDDAPPENGHFDRMRRDGSDSDRAFFHAIDFLSCTDSRRALEWLFVAACRSLEVRLLVPGSKPAKVRRAVVSELRETLDEATDEAVENALKNEFASYRAAGGWVGWRARELEWQAKEDTKSEFHKYPGGVIVIMGKPRSQREAQRCSSQRWNPVIPLAEVAAVCRAEAAQRKAVLSPLMPEVALRGVKPVARRALAILSSAMRPPLPSLRTLERWVSRAVERDRARGEWYRVELYLDDALQVEKGSDEAWKGSDAFRSGVIAMRANPKAGAAELWLAACREHAAYVDAGETETQAKKAVLKLLRATGLFECGNDTLRQTFSNRLARCKDGEAALQDGRKNNKGRKPVSAFTTLVDRQEIKRRSMDSGSERVAIDAHLRSPKCSPELRAAMPPRRSSKHNLPPSLRAVARVTPEQKAYNRGAKEFREMFKVYRDGTAEFPDGERRLIQPGDLLVYDDMSLNQPFWFEVNHQDDELAKRYGVGVGRQVLFSYDFASGRFNDFDLVARPRDAYRKEDVLRILLRSMEDAKPVWVRLEKGTWASNVIRGEGTHIFKPEDLEPEETGGLRAIGVKIHYCTGPQAKGELEGRFNFLQKVASMDIPGPDRGRWRGENSRDCAAIERVRQGRAHPREIGMLHVTEMRSKLLEVVQFCNSDPIEGRIRKGVPDEVWKAGIAANVRPKMEEWERAYLMPVQRTVRLQGGHATVKLDGNVFRFTDPSFARLGGKYPVRVCFDPTAPSAGAMIQNFAAGAENEFGYKLREFLVRAQYVQESPQIVSSGSDENVAHRKSFHAEFHSNYCKVGCAGEKEVSLVERRDGRGGVKRIARGKDFSGLEGISQGESEAERLIAEGTKARTEPTLTREERQARFNRAEESRLARFESGELWPPSPEDQEKLRLRALARAQERVGV